MSSPVNHQLPTRGEHPTAELLLAYRAGELGEAAANELREHLADCQACARILLDLAGRRRPRDPRLEAAWRGLASRLEAAQASETEAAEHHRPLRTGSLPRWRAGLLAASIAAALLATAAWLFLPSPIPGPPSGSAAAALERQLERARGMLEEAQRELVASERRAGELREQLEALRSPQLSVPRTELLPRGFLRGSAQGELRIPPQAPFVLLVLTPATPSPSQRYRIEISDAAGATLFHPQAALVADRRGNVEIALPADFLAVGRYEVRLRFEEGDETAGIYDLSVVSMEEPY